MPAGHFAVDVESQLAVAERRKDLIYWIKYTIAYSAIHLFNSRHSRRFALYDIQAKGDPEKLGFIVPQVEKDLESPHPESHLQENADEVLFYGSNSKSESVLLRIARGVNETAEAWLYLRLANGKTYSLHENSGYQQFFEGICTNFSCGNLQMHYLLPMRRWRIFYCGMLNETSSDDPNDAGQVVFVKIMFLWKASSDVYDLTFHTNPSGFADTFAKSEWNSSVPPLRKLSEVMNLYAQGGIINGTVSINDDDEYEIYLYGEKVRSLGKNSTKTGCKFMDLVGNVPGTGLNFHLGEVEVPSLLANFQHGFAVSPDGHLEIVKKHEINVKPSKSDVKANFKAGINYKVEGTRVSSPVTFNCNLGYKGVLEISFVEFTVGNNKGNGFLLLGEISKDQIKMVKSIPPPQFPKSVPLTVPFSDEVSHFGEISGGKGSSLGKLTKLSLEEKSFVVPKGIVVTTAAYKAFLTPEINSAIKHMENVLYGNTEGDTKEACNMVSNTIINSQYPKKIHQSISDYLQNLFGSELSKHKFAVRSSATGEDTAAMSAAGQMDTFLGIQGLTEILAAVKKCWASQFGYIAAEYKRRNGQVMNSPMAVVIQEMVASEVSGVLFTCDPVTNNPSVITITANYGLGETVVSGSVEPDTIKLKRDSEGNLQYDSAVVGTKLQQIVMTDSGRTVTEDVPENSRHYICLNKEASMQLSELAIKIEEYYKSPRDIEWGISKNIIYILQSRPITSATVETEYEIKHEFDVPLMCENEYITLANAGEVMPGATTPLGLDLVIKYMLASYRKQAVKNGVSENFMSVYTSGTTLIFFNHVMNSLAGYLTLFGFDTPLSKGFMIGIFGRIIDDPDMLRSIREKMESSTIPLPKFKIMTPIRHYWNLFFHESGTEELKKKLDHLHPKFMNYLTAKETFTSLMKSCSDFDSALQKQMTSSMCSFSWNMNLLQILSKARGGFDDDVFSDFARLLVTSNNVESANVPQAMQEVADQISKDIDSKKFKSMSDDEALQWLETSLSPSGDKFREFIRRHGHRCLKEFDVYTITWGMNPKMLVKLLQGMVGISKQSLKQTDDNYEKLFSELHTPLGIYSKMMLKFVLPKCQQAVRGREAGKSCTIKSFDHWRKGMRQLAKQMVSEGRVPEEDLVFFMTLEEIKDLLETRSPSIISRANFRKRLYPTLDSYIFPEIIKGLPKPISENDESSDNYEYSTELSMKGVPVSQGVAKGYVRVALNLEEASHLKQGEILITYSTDIGWSPYFPIISGVVTEIGGLISHGAVVSREYGLPCVVGMAEASRKFKTGDYVLLDGKKGILQKLPNPNSDEVASASI